MYLNKKISKICYAGPHFFQAKTTEGDWIPVIPREGSIVVNTGDLLEFVTSGIIRATVCISTFNILCVFIMTTRTTHFSHAFKISFLAPSCYNTRF